MMDSLDKAYNPEAVERTLSQAPDRYALDARVREAEPVQVGAPNQMLDTPIHLQGKEPDCLLRSAQMAEHRQLGKDPGLDAYKEPALKKGLYTPGPEGGTTFNRFPEVINERPDLHAELKHGVGPEGLKAALDGGKSVIANVDAHKFYAGRFYVPDRGYRHAIVVTGADQAPDGRWQFTVNDPNFPERNTPLNGKTFIGAWNDTRQGMITVQKSGVVV